MPDWFKKFSPLKYMSVSALVRLCLLTAMAIFCAYWSYCKIEKVRQSYQVPVETIPAGEEDINSKNAALELIKQSELFQGWSVLALGGIVAISVTTKVHRTPGIGWAYLFLAPAAIFLLNSLQAGWVVKKRYTFLVGRNNFSLYPTLSNLLQVQSELFLYSLLGLSLFAGWFLLFIVIGKSKPYELKEEKK